MTVWTRLGYTGDMDDNERRLAEGRSRVFKAMAHPTRMHIVSMLGSGSKNVGELTKAVGFDMSTVSKHLSILRSAGVVLDETRGTNVYYSLYCKCIPEFIHCVDEIALREACPRTWHFVAVRESISLFEAGGRDVGELTAAPQRLAILHAAGDEVVP